MTENNSTHRPVSPYILALIALIPFAVVGFLYREAHVDLRPALIWVAAMLAVLILAIAVLIGL